MSQTLIFEIKVSDIKVSPEYLDLVARASEDDHNRMRELARINGIMKAVEISNLTGLLVDGHERISVAKEEGIVVVPAVHREFASVEDEKLYIIDNSLARRNLTKWQIGKLVHEKLILESVFAEKRKKAGTLAPKRSKGRSAEIATNGKPISRTTQTKVEKILRDANDETLEKLEKEKITIDAAYKDLIKEVKKQQRKDEIEKVQVSIPNSIQLFNGDFRDNKIKNNSIALIFTDPDYTDYNIQVYSDLASQAMTVLKDGGSVLCYTGHYIIREVMNAMVEQGLKLHWMIPVLHSGPSSLMFSKKIMVGYKPLLWFTKGDYDGGHVKDVIKSEFQGKELHEWAQSTIESDYYIEHMTEENEIVYDPCMGQGTFGISAAKLNRQFVGSDINSEHYQTASKLITIALRESAKK